MPNGARISCGDSPVCAPTYVSLELKRRQLHALVGWRSSRSATPDPRPPGVTARERARHSGRIRGPFRGVGRIYPCGTVRLRHDRVVRPPDLQAAGHRFDPGLLPVLSSSVENPPEPAVQQVPVAWLGRSFGAGKTGWRAGPSWLVAMHPWQRRSSGGHLRSPRALAGATCRGGHEAHALSRVQYVRLGNYTTLHVPSHQERDQTRKGCRADPWTSRGRSPGAGRGGRESEIGRRTSRR